MIFLTKTVSIIKRSSDAAKIKEVNVTLVSLIFKMRDYATGLIEEIFEHQSRCRVRHLEKQNPATRFINIPGLHTRLISDLAEVSAQVFLLKI